MSINWSNNRRIFKSKISLIDNRCYYKMVSKTKLKEKSTNNRFYHTCIFYKYYSQYKNGGISKLEFGKLSELSMPTIYKYLSIVENKSN